MEHASDTATIKHGDLAAKCGNWKDKLKASAKNKKVQLRVLKISNISTYQHQQNEQANELKIYGIENCSISKIEQDTLTIEGLNDASFQEKWTKCVVQSKMETMKIDIPADDSIIMNKDKYDCENSILSFEEINNFIEENYKMTINENLFLRQEYHSILPFLLISSKEVHRMTLSDYEIKIICKSNKDKSKSRYEANDYYKIGLINFYKGKYFNAYNNFRIACKMKESDLNIAKWYCFSALVILFCDVKNHKLDFGYMKHISGKFDQEKVEEETEDSGFDFFPCCGSRNKNAKVQSIQAQILGEKESQVSLQNINYGSITGEIVEVLNGILSHEGLVQGQPDANKNVSGYNHSSTSGYTCMLNTIIETLWLHLLVNTYMTMYPNQKIFNKDSLKYSDAKICIKKIKERDEYLSYVAYGESSYLINGNYAYDTILRQLITKYPNRVEAYLRYWQLLTQTGSRFKNYQTAHSFSEIFWRNSSTMHFDDLYSIYVLYILITHAKSAFLVGNHFYSITYFQKEYPSNFMYPSIFYLFGKYSAKSKSKNLKNTAVSSLREVMRLLYEDLQFTALYWIGYVYYNTGHFDLCYPAWKEYLENSPKSFGGSQNKSEKISNFIKTYQVFLNSINDFKKNLNIFKKSKVYANTDHHTRTNSGQYKSLNNASTEMSLTKSTSTKLNYYLSTLQSIKEIEPNLKQNKNLIYDYYQALCYFYIDNNSKEAIRILMNIIHNKKHYMDPYFTLWKVLSSLKEFPLLLNFSYYMVKISHLSEVSYMDWIKSYTLYAKALVFNGKHEDAITLLINLLDIFANIPLEEIRYLSEIHKSNKISSTNVFLNFDFALQFYSKSHVYFKTKNIFTFNCTFGKNQLQKEKFTIKLDDLVIDNNGDYILSDKKPIKESEANKHDETIHTNSLVTESEHKLSKGHIPTSPAMKNIGIDTLEKMEEYLSANIAAVEIPNESPFLTVISNPKIFYLIGKICAKTETKIDLGVMCLKDYIHLVKFENNYKLNEASESLKQKAYFWLAILNIQQKNYSDAKKYIDKVDKLYEIDPSRKKTKLIKMFTEFYNQYSSLNESNLDFELSKTNLKEI